MKHSNTGYLVYPFHAHLLRLLALVPLPLCVDLRREWILELQRDLVHHKDQAAEHDARRLAIPQCGAQETHRAAVVHRRAADIERKSSHDLVHQDAEVVAQVGTRNTKGPHTGKDKDIAGSHKPDRQALRDEAL